MAHQQHPRPEIIRSASYWKDFHQRRARIANRAQREMLPGAVHLPAGAIVSQPPFITFLPNRDAPVYGIVQNNGTLGRSYNPICIQPTLPPPANNARAQKKLPARRDPLPCPGNLEKHRRRAARKYRHRPNGPSEDEKLLQRLTRTSQNQPSGRHPPELAHRARRKSVQGTQEMGYEAYLADLRECRHPNWSAD
ncbi:hypothetical protein C8R45DRAFT_1089398 [Mycena sanguinolenta]|nr:hypothetical protein C8R45DRAFT_1089398 [Mycena sanguinolenta]